MTYEYLRKFIPGGSGVNDNWFMPIPQEEIDLAEKMLKHPLLSLLKEFYKEIGFGKLRSPISPPQGYEFYAQNEILPPTVAAHFAQAIIRAQTEPYEEPIEFEDHWINNACLDLFEPGDLPFFEIGDSYQFLVMKPQSEEPNAVWTSSGIKIENSLERFIWRLYHEDPGYYGDIIEAHYGKLEG